MGLIGDTYCEKTSWKYNPYNCDYRNLSEDQLKELGMTPWGDKRAPAISELQNEGGCINRIFADECKEGEQKVLHGTSYEQAQNVIRSGFKTHTGTLGKGAYFVTPSNIPPVDDLKIVAPLNYALRNKMGSVIMACLPRDQIKNSKDLQIQTKDIISGIQVTGWKSSDLAKEFARLSGSVPDTIQGFFNRHGHKYDTKEEMHQAYNDLGKKVQEFALSNGIKAWDESNQIIIYDDELLRGLQFKEIEECRSF